MTMGLAAVVVSMHCTVFAIDLDNSGPVQPTVGNGLQALQGLHCGFDVVWG
jgi:hypothetical protein